MPIRPLASLRGRLLLFLATVFAALFLGVLGKHADDLRHARESGQHRALDLARGYAHLYERLLRDRLALLDTLLRMPGFQAEDAIRCEASLRHIVATDPSLVNLAVVDAGGRLRCAARAGGLGPLAAATLRRAMDSRGALVGMSGEEGQARPYLALARPIIDGDAAVRGALIAFLDRDWLNARFAETVPEGVVLRILDGDGVFVVRQPDPACCIGKTGLQLDGIGRALAGGETLMKGRWLDGVERLQADLPLKPPLSGVVSIGIPEDRALTEAERGTRRLTWLLAALCLLFFGLAWYLTEHHLLQPLRTLSAGARQLREGRLSHRLPATPGGSELDALQRDFNAMADMLEARQRAIAEDMEQLRLAQQVFEQASEAIMITDEKGEIVAVNPGFTAITGYAAEEAVGRNPRILQSGRQDAAFYRAMWDDLLARGRWSGEIWNRHKDGSVHPQWQSVSAVRNGAGAVTRYVAVFTDLTLRRTKEEVLRASEKRLAALIEIIPDAIFLKDGAGRWQVINQAARSLFGVDGLPWQGRSDLDLVKINPLRSGEHMACWDSDEQAWRAGSTRHFTEVIGLEGGGTGIFDVVKVPQFDEAGARQSLIVVGRDTTALRRMNEELERRVAERTRALETANRELESFSYSVSHDLRAPLRAINGFAQLVEEEYAGHFDVQGLDYLQRIRKATVKMGRLIDHLLGLAQVSRHVMEFEEVDLSALAEEIAGELQASEPGRRVEWSIGQGIRAECDAELLRAVLENLLGNAWKYASRRETARIGFGAERRDGRTVYSVSDNGAGFDMAHAGKLFGAFQRLHAETEYPGSGIGLATVSRIIHRHGGKVWATGKPDAGATFFFTLSPRE